MGIALTAPMKLNNIPQIERDEWILAKVKGKKVLHAGATDNLLTEGRAEQGLLHQKLRQVDCSLVGVDIDIEGIDYLNRQVWDRRYSIWGY